MLFGLLDHHAPHTPPAEQHSTEKHDLLCKNMHVMSWCRGNIWRRGKVEPYLLSNIEHLRSAQEGNKIRKLAKFYESEIIIFQQTIR